MITEISIQSRCVSSLFHFVIRSNKGSLLNSGPKIEQQEASMLKAGKSKQRIYFQVIIIWICSSCTRMKAQNLRGSENQHNIVSVCHLCNMQAPMSIVGRTSCQDHRTMIYTGQWLELPVLIFMFVFLFFFSLIPPRFLVIF